MFIRSSSLLPLAGTMLASVSRTYADNGQTCNSYGIDIVNGGSYFINTNSNDPFSSVSQFSGCNNDTANVIVAGPNGIETYCQDIPLNPDYTSELSLCPDLLKSAMSSGDYELTLISNNGDGEPFANQRDFYISAGPQATSTATPTLIYNYTTTPTVTATTTSWITSTVTVNNTETVTVPSATVVITKTPRPTTVTSTTTLTRTLKTWTRTAYITTSTVTATCTVPPRPWQPDPTWHRKPQILAALPTGLSTPNQRRANDFAIRDALRKERRTLRLADEIEGRKLDKRNMAKRSVDAPTITVTETTYTATSTATYTADTSTVPAIEVSTTTTTTYLPPSTVVSGVAKQTVTAPQQTKTRLSVSTTYSWTTKTMTASYTRYTTVTPTASVTACKKQGGHFGGGWW